MYSLTAFGSANGTVVQSAPVSIDIERADVPVKVNVDPNFIILTETHQSMPLTVRGTFADASSVDITRSTLTAYSSENSAVATVNSAGLVTGVKTGKTRINISTPDGQVWNIPVTVP